MPSFEIRGIRPQGNDPDKFANDLKDALRETGKDAKGSIKKIKVIDDSVRFTIEPTAAISKVIEAIRGSLHVDVKPASTPLEAFAERYGLNPSMDQQ